MQLLAQDDFGQPDGWGYVPTLLVVCPEVTQYWKPAGYCVGLGAKTATTRSAMPMGIFSGVRHQFLPSQWAIANACLPQQTLQDPQVGLVLLWSHWSALSPSTCEHSDLQSGVSASSVLWGSCTQALLTFKAKCFGGPSSNATLLSWEPDGSPLLWEKLCDIIFQLGHPPSMYGIWIILWKHPSLPSHCGFFFVFVCRIALLESLSLLIDSCSAVSCNVGVFLERRWVQAYSTILLLQKPESQYDTMAYILLLWRLGPSLGFLFTFPFWPWVSNFISVGLLQS